MIGFPKPGHIYLSGLQTMETYTFFFISRQVTVLYANYVSCWFLSFPMYVVGNKVKDSMLLV